MPNENVLNGAETVEKFAQFNQTMHIPGGF